MNFLRSFSIETRPTHFAHTCNSRRLPCGYNRSTAPTVPRFKSVVPYILRYLYDLLGMALGLSSFLLFKKKISSSGKTANQNKIGKTVGFHTSSRSKRQYFFSLPVFFLLHFFFRAVLNRRANFPCCDILYLFEYHRVWKLCRNKMVAVY